MVHIPTIAASDPRRRYPPARATVNATKPVTRHGRAIPDRRPSPAQGCLHGARASARDGSFFNWNTVSVDPAELDAHLDRVLIGPRQPGPVTLVKWDPAWPARFERERARIRQALPGVARRVEHIGSTAVRGLAAKPIIDILVTVADVNDEATVVSRLEKAGYVLRVREPGHRMFRTPDLSVQVHVLDDGDDEADRYLVFRDRLRSSPQDRAVYERLKRELAGREWEEIGHYAHAKGPLIEAILARARARGI
jgi:GrpB-like predicted nucleotidyltransferase (UPF0157 family)